MFCGYLRQSTAATIMLGPIVDDDGIAVATGLTISQADVRLSKNAGNMAQKNESTSCTHDELGVYTCPLDTTDTNTLGLLDVVVQESGNLVCRQSYMVITAGEWDRLMSATGPIPNSGIVARGTAQAATGTTIQLASGETFGDDTVVGMTVMAYGSTQGYWQSRQITDYVLSTDTATVDTWTVTPSGTITYIVLGSPPASATAPPAVNVVQVSGDATAADTLELFAEALDQSTGQLDSGSLAASTITAAAIATDAITDAKLATGAITAAKFAANAITSTVVADNTITAAKLAADAITSDKIAANAIGASELAADAVTEIQSGLATAAALATTDGKVDDILTDTGTTLPAIIEDLTDGTTPVVVDDAPLIAALLATTIDGVTISDYLSVAGGANFSISGTTLTMKDVAGNTIFTRDLTLASRNAINAAAP